MPLYNGEAYVRDAVRSLLAQTFRDFELLVVDDGSTDHGPDHVRAFTDERIRLLTCNENSGPAAARNLAIAAMRGRYVVFFDSDDLACPDMLENLAGCISTDPGCDIVFGWNEGIDEAGRLNGINNQTVINPEKLSAGMLFKNYIPTSGLMVKRECFDREKFDETLVIASDFEMWTRILAGRRVKQLSRVLNQYRTHSKNITNRKKAVAAECMDRIFRGQLARLGIDPATEEAVLHAQLCAFTFGTPKETVLAAENWLLKLDAANTKTGFYSAQPFREVLGERWYAVCHSACGHGFWTWRIYHRSPLATGAILTTARRYQLFRLCTRGALKKLLKFRKSSPEIFSDQSRL